MTGKTVAETFTRQLTNDPIGKIVRATSVDELPQLFNVLKGDMALIGPRPLLVQYQPLYNEEQARRHEVRPGITGWASKVEETQSAGKEIELDIWYVDHVCFMTDMMIFYKTLKCVISCKGISQKGEATTKTI